MTLTIHIGRRRWEIALGSAFLLACVAVAVTDTLSTEQPFLTAAQPKAAKKNAEADPKGTPHASYTVPPSAATLITMKTIPGASCTLCAEGETKVARGLVLHPDRQGVVRFYVSAPKELNAVKKFVVVATLNGKATRYPLDLRVSAKATMDMPAPAVATAPPPKGLQVLPALTKQDASQISGTELLKRGYPPRPDAKKTPRAFAAWWNVVSRPVSVLTEKATSKVGGHDRHAFMKTATAPSKNPAKKLVMPSADSQANNWSGFLLLGDPGTYNVIQATWSVPGVFFPDPSTIDANGNGKFASSLIWVGLDGDSNFSDWNPLVQAGTRHDAQVIQGMNMVSVNAWTEVYNLQPDMQVIDQGTFPIKLGDGVTVTAYVGDSQRAPNLAGGFAWFTFTNLASGMVYTTSTPLPGLKPAGRTAEWIMERWITDGNTNFNDLAQPDASFPLRDTFVTMQGCSVTNLKKGASVGYRDDPNLRVIMTSDGTSTGTVLATEDAIDDQSFRFSWQAYR